jgi:hypothetical protein
MDAHAHRSWPSRPSVITALAPGEHSPSTGGSWGGYAPPQQQDWAAILAGPLDDAAFSALAASGMLPPPPAQGLLAPYSTPVSTLGPTWDVAPPRGAYHPHHPLAAR